MVKLFTALPWRRRRVTVWVWLGCTVLLIPLLFLIPFDVHLSTTITSPGVLSDLPVINTRCPHKFNAPVANAGAATSHILIVGYVTDLFHEFRSKFQHGGHTVSFMSLEDNCFRSNMQTHKHKHEPEKFRKLLVACDKLPDEIHVICEVYVSGSREEPWELTSFVEDYVTFLQGLSLEPTLRALPVFVHLVGTAGTKSGDGDTAGSHCDTPLDYKDMRSLMFKQVELYSNVYRHIHRQQITLLQR